MLLISFYDQSDAVRILSDRSLILVIPEQSQNEIGATLLRHQSGAYGHGIAASLTSVVSN